MAPARASATTSASSARLPQFEKITGVSAGTDPKRMGNEPPPTPTIETWPPAATAPAARSRVASTPTKSSTSSAPRPPAARRTSGAVSGSASSVTAAPAAAAASRAAGRRSTATTRQAAGARLGGRRRGVDRDDATGGERTQERDGDVAEPADADDDDARTGTQGQRAPDRVVGRQPGVGEGRGPDGIDVAEGDQVARRRDDHVLGEPAVPAEARAAPADGLGSLAEVLLPQAAAPAATAAPGAVDDHGLADVDAVGARPERRDDARHLVAERERQLVRDRPGGPVHEVQVGVAQAGRANLEQDLAGTGLGPRHGAQPRRLLPGGELDGRHGPRRAIAGRRIRRRRTGAPQRLRTVHALTPGAP